VAKHEDRGRTLVLGIGVDAVSARQAVERLLTWIREERCRQVVTVNPEFIMTARRNAAFRRVLQNADLAVADGIGTVLAARILGHVLPERVGGVDLVRQIAVSASPGTRLFLLGAEPGIAAMAGSRLVERNAGLCIAGTYAGSPRPEHEDDIVSRIVGARPDVLLVAYGAPAQELWIARNKDRLHVPVCIGVGGAFDFISGHASRAPQLVQRAGLEWLYRLAREPWRWRRMLALPRFAVLVLVERGRLAWSAVRRTKDGPIS
jgi:N-acetylglucosaminyldiphosphoundecaprenol N-acetyl-beta-D-mannosaminyltransferase